jgi:Ni,Fe-hydrogenase maturation factor
MEGDAFPIRLLLRLRKEFSSIKFIELDPTENFPEENHLIIVDTIANTQKVVMWDDIDAIQSSPSYSLHDFDLGMTLKLMKKMGKLKRVTIFGVPPSGSEENVFQELKTTMSSLLSKSASHN